ncbi:MAG: 50S ribosomal protein L10 [Nitrococcus mobilis]|nr:50S ribosomal protein L10 [Nitrococcus mobilis]
MGLSLDQKQRMVRDLAGVASEAHSALAAEYRGLTAAEMDQLRVKAREAGVYLKIIKNTLAKRAVAGTRFECMTEGFEGPLLLAFSRQDPASAARIVQDFSKDHAKLVVKMVAIGGKLYPATEADRLASLPTYEEALSRLMATMRAPIQKLATTLNEVPGKLVRTLAAVRDAKPGG